MNLKGLERAGRMVVLVSVAILSLGSASHAAPVAPRTPSAPVRSGPAAWSTRPPGLHRIGSSPIQHIIFVIQENRSFNNLFLGYAGAATQNYGYDHNGNKIPLTKVGLTSHYDILHRFTQAVAAIDYKNGEAMDGFDLQQCKGAGCKTVIDPAYAYFQQSNDPNRTGTWPSSTCSPTTSSPSHLDGSFEGHQYLIAGQSEADVGHSDQGSHWGCDGGTTTRSTPNTSTKPGTTTTNKIQACFDPPVTQTIDKTLADELDAARS